MSIAVTTQHPVLACAGTIEAALDAVADVQPAFMTTADKELAALRLEALERRVTELKVRVLAVADDVADKHGARDVATWFASATRADSGQARAEVELGKAMDSRWARLREGMADGAVSVAQATVVRRALEDLPAEVEAETVSSAEGVLVEYAAQFPPAPLRRIGRRILEVVAPDAAEEEEARRLRREEQEARQKAYLRFRRMGDGTSKLTARLPDTVVDRLRTYVEAFTSPRQQDVDGDAGSFGPAPLAPHDRMPADRRYAHGFAALLELLDPARLPAHGGDATTVLVTIGLEQLRRDLAAAGVVDADLDQGANMSADEVRRLACSAQIIPVVLGGKGQPLDLGRSRRLFSPAQRKAIRLCDRRRRAEGCRVKAAWTEIHHLTPWSQGGATNVGDGICLCNDHHHRMHDHRYRHQRLPDGDLRFHRRT